MLCDRLSAAEAGLKVATEELDRALAAEAERVEARQAAQASSSAVEEERYRQLAANPEEAQATLAQLDRLRARVASVVAGGLGIAVAAEAGATQVEVSSPKKPRVSVFDLLLRSGGKRSLDPPAGAAAAAASHPAAAGQLSLSSEEAVDLL